jgi:hypothetical protein
MSPWRTWKHEDRGISSGSPSWHFHRRPNRRLQPSAANATMSRRGCVSPTVLRSGPYRFFFFSSDRPEPAHVHVSRDRKVAKFWLEPVAVASDGGFPQNELNKIAALVQEHRAALLKAWHDFFKPNSGNGGGKAGAGH